MKRHLTVFLLFTLAACDSGVRSTDQSLDSTGVFHVKPVRPVAELLPTGRLEILNPRQNEAGRNPH